MEITGLVDARNIMAFSLILMSGALFPDAAATLSSELAIRLKRFHTAVRTIASWKRPEERSTFWEIDMTKFEP